MATKNQIKTIDYLVKILIIGKNNSKLMKYKGDSGVGKTNILLRICDNKFSEVHLSTIGKIIKLRQKKKKKKKINNNH